jgi:anti-anti-sigma regulatory factor
MAALRRTTIVYDVGSLAADAGTVDVLAHLHVELQRRGHDLYLRDASPELRALLDLCGLAGVLRLELEREAEERE